MNNSRPLRSFDTRADLIAWMEEQKRSCQSILAYYAKISEMRGTTPQLDEQLARAQDNIDYYTRELDRQRQRLAAEANERGNRSTIPTMQIIRAIPESAEAE